VRSGEDLMAAYQRGDSAAFAELMARYETPLWNFLRHSLRDDSLAEDLLQETFMRVVKNASHYQPTARFSTWLYTIARNLCIDHQRAAAHRKTRSLDGKNSDRDSDPDRQLHDTVANAQPTIEHTAIHRELIQQLNTAVDALPTSQREVFLMREVLELPFAEIAATVGASEATVKSRMRYALEALRNALGERHAQPPEVML